MVQGSDIILAVIAIIFPPAAVAMMTGCSCDLLINLALTLLGYFPGHIHAFWILWKKIKAEEIYGPQGFVYLGNGEYVGSGNAPPPPHYAGQGQPQYAAQPHYGATR